MKVKKLTTVEYGLTRKGVQVMYRDFADKDDRKVWISCGDLYGWHTIESAMNLAKAIIKLRSDLRKAGVKI